MTENLTPAQHAMSSCVGAVLTSVIMSPLDVVKIRLQAQQKPFKAGSCFIYNNGLMDCLCVCSHCHGDANSKNPTSSRIRPWYERPGHFNGTLDAFVKITRNEGVTALWSGLPPTLYLLATLEVQSSLIHYHVFNHLGNIVTLNDWTSSLMSIPSTVIYFTVYDRIKYGFGYDEHDPSTRYIPVGAGILARALAVVLFNPLELLRTKMQSKPLSYFQLKEAIKISIDNNGLAFLMKGLGPSLLRDIPFSAIYWFGYEFAKSYQMRHYQTTDVNLILTFASGAACGSLAALLTLPFDVVKTHRQIEMGEAEVAGTSKKLVSTWTLLRELYGKRGFSGLYAGVVPRMIKVAPACAIMITTYECAKSFFRSQNKEMHLPPS